MSNRSNIHWRVMCQCFGRELNLAGKHMHMDTNSVLLLYDFIHIWRRVLELPSSPLKPGKPTGIQWERQRGRKDQSKQQRNALHQSKLLLSALPLACRGMCNYTTIKVPVLVTVCVGAWASRCLVTTLNHVNNVAWTGRAISHKWVRECKREGQSWYEKKTSFLSCEGRRISCSDCIFNDSSWTFSFFLLWSQTASAVQITSSSAVSLSSSFLSLTTGMRGDCHCSTVYVMHSNHWAHKSHTQTE